MRSKTGRVGSIAEVEDVFAATIVVPDASRIGEAEDVIRSKYTIEARRPDSSSTTAKPPDSFRFDDVRLYVRYRQTEGERTAIPDGLLSYIEVKTFLQHAWAVATHDLIYKTEQRDSGGE